jgi:hypothetical protein
MMEFRLLLDLEVLQFLQRIAASRRRRVFALFERIQEFPHRYSDFVDRDDLGRRLDVCVFEGFAIYYWVDTADKHIKILKVTKAERMEG